MSLRALAAVRTRRVPASRLRRVSLSTNGSSSSTTTTTKKPEEEKGAGAASGAVEATTAAAVAPPPPPPPREAEVDGGVLEGAVGKDLGRVVRHGRGDATITLNVGGKEFVTLRSTVNANPVLADHVARAEANRETTKTGAVFIDRDPTHFGFVLTYLRNKVEMLTYSKANTISLTKFSETYCRLPDDRDTLRDLFVEASYYRIPELQDTLTRTGWLVKLTDLLGAGNPFDSAAKWMHRVRTFMVTFTAFGTLGGTVLLAVKTEVDVLFKAIGIRDKEAEDEEVSIWRALGFKKKKDPEPEPPSIVEAIQQIVEPKK